jgi:hypothetical protein
MYARVRRSLIVFLIGLASGAFVETTSASHADAHVVLPKTSISRIVGDPDPDPVALGSLLDTLASRNLAATLRVCRCIPQDRPTTILSTVAEYRHLDGIAVKLVGYKLRIEPTVDKPVPLTPVPEILFFVSHDFGGDCETLMYVAIRTRDLVPATPRAPDRRRFVDPNEILYYPYLLSGDEAHLSRVPCGMSRAGDSL